LADDEKALGGNPMKYTRVVLAVLAIVVTFSFVHMKPLTASATGQSPFESNFSLVDKAGNIAKPSDYLDKYQVLGSYFVLDPAGNQMHMTYASPGAAEYYRQNGQFADGTVLVKEVLGTEHAEMTTGDAHWATGTKVWFVMVRDSAGRHKDSKLWGEGWDWSLYKSDAPDKQVAVSFKNDCQGCHVPAQKTGWIYVQGYPVLKSAK
jgi:hypothetical protein